MGWKFTPAQRIRNERQAEKPNCLSNQGYILKIPSVQIENSRMHLQNEKTSSKKKHQVKKTIKVKKVIKEENYQGKEKQG